MSPALEAVGLNSAALRSAPDNVATSETTPDLVPVEQSHGAGNKQTASNRRRPPVRKSQPNNPSASTPICRFFGTKKGCRAGDQCPYRHIQTRTDDKNDITTTEVNEAATSSDRPLPVSVKPPAKRATVTKPISSIEKTNPREFQIGQVVRRFSPFRADIGDVTTLKFRLLPSDPDFPFELGEGLQCILSVPLGYPQNGEPSLKIENPDMPKGFQINVERGFEELVKQFPKKSLLALLNDLDKRLEAFLTAEKAQTIKLVANAKKQEAPVAQATGVTPELPRSVASNLPKYSVQQLSDAKSRRGADVRQLEARMGRLPLFSKAGDGLTFNIPLQIAKPANLPAGLQSLKEAVLVVPEVYPLDPCTIMLKGVGNEADNVEFHFEKHAKESSAMSLIAHINYLTQNVHKMALEPIPQQKSQPLLTEDLDETAQLHADIKESDDTDDGVTDSERPHLKFLARPPPEWSLQPRTGYDDTESSSSDYDSEVSTDQEVENDQPEGGASLPTATVPGPERGVSISLPQLELIGVELLQFYSLSLTVKCGRCKTAVDIKDIKPSTQSNNIRRTESCIKCSTPVTVQFRAEPMHTNSSRAGYLDLEGCSTITDMLPSAFLPTCSECSTTASSVVSVRGETSMSVCRNCHNKLSFKVPEVKFLRISTAVSGSLPLRQKQDKESLGVSAGTELPSRGNCKHYSKSYRWFRFSCCNKVYPCDRCHDAEAGHPNEHAERMICGWCSREQRYRPEDCRFCGKNVIRKVNTRGFWEGGKGTRDKGLMSRKEKRKFKRPKKSTQ